jgi:ribosomal protein S7
MAEILRYPSLFKTWDQAESIVRKNLEGSIQKKDEDHIVSRFKESFQNLPPSMQEITIQLEGAEQLSPKDLEMVRTAIHSAMDQMQKQMQTFAGHVLGEIFALVLDLWKCETKLEDNTLDTQSSDN